MCQMAIRTDKLTHFNRKPRTIGEKKPIITCKRKYSLLPNKRQGGKTHSNNRHGENFFPKLNKQGHVNLSILQGVLHLKLQLQIKSTKCYLIPNQIF